MNLSSQEEIHAYALEQIIPFRLESGVTPAHESTNSQKQLETKVENEGVVEDDDYSCKLKELNLTEGTELYRFGLLLLNLKEKDLETFANYAPYMLRYQADNNYWQVVDCFCELTKKDVHDRIEDEYSPIVGDRKSVV